MRTTTWVAFCLLFSAVGIQAAESERIAPVIGNAAYDSGALANPVSDTQLLRDTLKADGFAVTYLANSDRGQIVRAIQASVNSSPRAARRPSGCSTEHAALQLPRACYGTSPRR
jgi:hypothetical protein